MQDVVDSFAGGPHRSGIAQVHLPKVDPVIKPARFAALPVR